MALSGYGHVTDPAASSSEAPIGCACGQSGASLDENPVRRG